MSVNVAVVGLGYWGPNLARTFARLPGATLRILCDANEERLATIACDYPGVQTTADYGAVLEDPEVDAVVLATPAATHFALASAALRAGKHVLVEKPLAQTTEQARELVDLADSSQRTLMVGHVFLYNAVVQKIKELIDGGALGRIYYVYAQRLNLGIIRQDVNALWNFAPHDVSVINYWLGNKPTSVSAHGYAYIQPGIEDVVFMTMEYPGGVAANVHVSWLDPHKVRRITVVGSERMVEFDDVSADSRLVIYERKAVAAPAGASPQQFGPALHKNGVVTHAGDVVIPRVTFGEPLKTEARHFVQCIVQGTKPLSDGSEGLRVVEVLECADRALKCRAPIALRSTVADDC